MTNEDPASDTEGYTIPFAEYRKKMEDDSNNWWRTSSGHQLNLFEDACRIIDQLASLPKELSDKIQRAIDNIRKLKPDAGSTRAFGESYDEGRADAYSVVLGWLDELEKN
jgi:hypothetical protein